MFTVAIKSLVGANKTVFSYIGTTGDDVWDNMLEPKDQALYTERVNRLTQTIKDFSISGIILGIYNLYVSIQLYFYIIFRKIHY